MSGPFFGAFRTSSMSFGAGNEDLPRWLSFCLCSGLEAVEFSEQFTRLEYMILLNWFELRRFEQSRPLAFSSYGASGSGSYRLEYAF